MSRSFLLVTVLFLTLVVSASAQLPPGVSIPQSNMRLPGTERRERKPTNAELEAAREAEQVKIGVTSAAFATVRDGLVNCRQKFLNEKKGRVAFLGGSITVATGWRDDTCEFLKKTYPETEFDFINAGVGGTNSTYGAFRLEQDVFKNGPVDLLFLEFAVNDAGNVGPANRRCRAIEGIVRHARKQNPAIDILIMYFADKGKTEYINKGEKLDVVFDHEEIAAHYGLPALDLAQEIAGRLKAGEFRWEEFSADTCHPTPFGHTIYGDAIKTFLGRLWVPSLVENSTLTPHKDVTALDPFNYENAHFVPLDAARPVNGWSLVKGWDAEKKCNYDGAVDVLTAETPGAELQLDFEGSLVGVDAIAGMDAGILQCVVDDTAKTKVNLFDDYCVQFHRPVCHVLAENLPAGKHTVKITIAPDRDGRSTGTVARIRKFVVN